MSESSEALAKKNLQKVVRYVEEFFASDLPDKWRVDEAQYADLAKKAVAELAQGASRGGRLVRLAGRSGSGKTTQLLPAAEAWFGEDKAVVVAAREFVKFHPNIEEIKREYDASEVRKKTDGFACVMMFLVLQALVKLRYDIILDLAFVNVKIEEILVGMVMTAKYQMWMMMVVAPAEVARRRLASRGWRHDEKGEAEFARATEDALKFYAEEMPEMRIVVWGMADLEPGYDGAIKGVFATWREKETEKVAEVDLKELVAAKIKYITK